MKIRKQFFQLVFIAFLFQLQSVVGQKVFIDENISYWNDINNEVHVDHSVFFDEDSAHIIMEISFTKGKN